MPLRDFISTSVRVGQFVCGPPTVATVHLALGAFSMEIAALLQTWEKLQGVGSEPREQAIHLFARGPEKLAAVLGTCVRPAEPGASLLQAVKADPRVGEDLIRAVLSVCDIDRIVGSLDLSVMEPSEDAAEVATEDEPDQGPGYDPGDVALIGLCGMTGMKPMEVQDMPYEAYLSALDAATVLRTGKPSAEQTEVATAEQLGALPGVGVVN